MKILCLAILTAAACGQRAHDPVDGDCRYFSTTGTCTITNVGMDGSPGPTTYDFVADGRSNVSYQGRVLDANGSMVDPECASAARFSVGEQRSCTLGTLTTGTCEATRVVIDGYDPGSMPACE